MDLSKKILKQLVEIKSYSGQEKNLADCIMDLCQKNHLPAEKQDKNIVIKYLAGSKKCLIFNAHMDTVNAGNPQSWQYPPFGKKAGVVKEGKMFGLGTSDDKGGITSLLLLAKTFLNKKPPIDIFITFVVNEELEGTGSQSFLSWFKQNHINKYQDVSVIIAEPTDCYFIEIGHRGNYFLQLKTTGVTGHSSNPEIIENQSIEKMLIAILKIKKLSKELKTFYFDKTLGYPTVCLTGLTSSKASVNKIPFECYSNWDIRTTPFLHDKLLNILEKKLGEEVSIKLIGKPANYGLTENSSNIVKVFKKTVSNLKINISQASNDICFFTQIGIPAVAFGPGNKESVHKENEFIELKNIQKSVDIYSQVIEAYF